MAPHVPVIVREKRKGVILSIWIYSALHTSVSGPKSSSSVHNGVSQTSAELQWQWHSFLNSNGVLKNGEVIMTQIQLTLIEMDG